MPSCLSLRLGSEVRNEPLCNWRYDQCGEKEVLDDLPLGKRQLTSQLATPAAPTLLAPTTSAAAPTDGTAHFGGTTYSGDAVHEVYGALWPAESIVVAAVATKTNNETPLDPPHLWVHSAPIS